MRNQPAETDSAQRDPGRHHFIPEWAAATGKSPGEIADYTGADKSVVSRWLGKETVPQGRYLKALATLFDLKDASELFREPPHAGVEEDRANLPTFDPDLLDYAGILEAGAFREVDELDQRQPHKIPHFRSPQFPKAKHMAWKVMGDSMDLEHIVEGMWVEGVDIEEFTDYYGDLRDGDFVVVERSEAQGARRERTVKKLAVFPDRWELHPRSSNPKHQVIKIPRGHDPSRDSSAVIIGLVVRWFMEPGRR